MTSLDARLARLEHAAPAAVRSCACPFDHDETPAVLAGEAPGDVCRRCGRPYAVALTVVTYEEVRV
jgi:hypothetical protein